MTLCLVWHESRKVGWCSRSKALSSLRSQCSYMFLYLSSGRSGDHRGLRLWPGFPIFHHVLMVAVHFRNPLRGCAGFQPFDCRNRYARGVDDLRCRPGHNSRLVKCRFPDTASEKVMHAKYVSIIMHKNMEMLIDSYRISPSRYECYTTAFVLFGRTT